jgi:hypothetical protein
MSLRTNREALVEMSVLGEISSPVFRKTAYSISPDGQAVILPGVGGITYNIRVGDRAVGWESDHVEPGVSIKSSDQGERNASAGLNLLACIGNQARVVSGEAKGETGVVTGKHGGIEHVLLNFPPAVLARLVIGDKIMVRAWGLGLKLLDFPLIKVMNIDPLLLDSMPWQGESDVLLVPVTHVIPAAVMGSGLGSSHAYSGDYDIQLADPSVVEEHGLGNLRLGDVVGLLDSDHTFGRTYRKGACSIGVVVHCDCVGSGHGPGVTSILACSSGQIQPVIDSGANLAGYLGIQR